MILKGWDEIVITFIRKWLWSINVYMLPDFSYYHVISGSLTSWHDTFHIYNSRRLATNYHGIFRFDSMKNILCVITCNTSMHSLFHACWILALIKLMCTVAALWNAYFMLHWKYSMVFKSWQTLSSYVPRQMYPEKIKVARMGHGDANRRDKENDVMRKNAF